jgi:MoxR-like ATPase
MAEASAHTIKINLHQAVECVLDVLHAGKVPMLVSDPGLGKSSLGRQIAEKHNLKFVDIRLSQCDPVDLNGFPSVDKERGRGTYLPMDMWPLEGDELPINPKTGKQYSGWFIMLDEINSCPKAVEVASYKILLDREVGMHKLNKRVWLMGAGNLKTSKAVVNDTGTAQQSRMVWFEIQAHMPTWIRWADKAGIDHRVKSYLQFKPDMLHKFDPNHQDKTFPCPRTWHFMSDIMKPWVLTVPQTKLPTIAGTVGAGPAREFHSFCQIYEDIPTMDQIMADPEHCHFGNEPSMHYALAGMIAANLKASNAAILFTFLNRLAADFQVTAVRAAIARDRSIKKEAAFREWYKTKSYELVY